MLEKKAESKKPVAGFYAITGCQGCLLSVIFNEDDILDILNIVDIKAFPFIKEFDEADEFDILFIEGCVAQKDDLDVIEKLAKRAKIIVALGACSGTGAIPAFRHFVETKRYEHLKYDKVLYLSDITPEPIDKYIKVDYYIPGCPPDREEVKKFIKALALGKVWRDNDDPVCVECKLNNNKCLLEDKKMCLGPITKGGCNSICTNGGFECWGCRGATTDANFEEMFELIKEKGYDTEEIYNRLQSFIGLKIPKKYQKGRVTKEEKKE